MNWKYNKQGFTLIELLLVVAIIGLLAGIVLVSVEKIRARARDARRLSDMKQILLALEIYKDINGVYPGANPGDTDRDCHSWDVGYEGGSGNEFIRALQTTGFFSKTPGDPIADGDYSPYGGDCDGYFYHRFTVDEFSECGGNFFVLGIKDMETSNGKHPASPGWKCGSLDWGMAFEWVTGGLEN